MHGTVSPLRNRFLSMIRSQTLAFGRKCYGRLSLATTGLFGFSQGAISAQQACHALLVQTYLLQTFIGCCVN